MADPECCTAEQAFETITIVGDGFIGVGGAFVANSIASARNIPSSSHNISLQINGNMTGGDGVSHLYYTWDNASVLANNNGDVLASNDAGAGRWIQN